MNQVLSVHKQSGVALVSIMLLLALMSMLAIYQMEGQNLSIRMSTNLVEAEQAFQIATGGEQWAVKILERDMVEDLTGVDLDTDYYGEAWSNLGPPVKVEGTESFMQVLIQDQQGLFNLNNLMQGKPPPPGSTQTIQIGEGGDSQVQQGENSSQVDEEQDGNAESASGEIENNAASGDQGESTAPHWYALFQRLLVALELDPFLADTVVDWIDPDNEPTGVTGAEDPFYSALGEPYLAANRQMSSVGELYRVRGFTPEIIAKLVPYVTVIPIEEGAEYPRININTAPAPILAALSGGPTAPAETYDVLVETRLQAPYKSVEDFMIEYGTVSPVAALAGIEQLLDVKSDFFLSRSCAETGNVKLSQITSLKKNRDAENVTVQHRKSTYGCPDLHSQNESGES